MSRPRQNVIILVGFKRSFFCLFYAVFAARVVFMAPSFAPLAPSPGWLAARAAAAAGVLAVVRLSAHSFSGSVGIVFFSSSAQAAAFARSLAAVLGVSLVVRGWRVSVPVFLGGEPC